MSDKNNSNKIPYFKGLRGQFFAVCMISEILLALSVVSVGIFVIRTAMYGQVRAELDGCVSYVENYYKELPGDFRLVIQNNTGYIYKGDTDITEDYEMLDRFSASFSADVSVFCNDVRVLTTFRDADGKRLVNTGCAYAVYRDVVKDGKESFYTNVLIDNDKYFAYYRPIYLSDGTVFGMYGVCRNAADVNKGIYRTIIPIILIFAAAAVAVALVTAAVAGRTVNDLNLLNRFMERVAKSDFEADLPGKMLQADDEVGVLAKTGKQMQNSIRKLVDYDALTEVHNRRFGTSELNETFKKSEEYGTVFCVALADIDFFKKVNDTYGHDAGDIVLKEMAGIFKRHMVGHGFVARWGGEEFLFVITETQLAQARELMLDIFDEVRELEIEYKDFIISPRISAGLVQADRGEDADQCVKRADDLLYYAKEHGRNRLVTPNDVSEGKGPETDEGKPEEKTEDENVKASNGATEEIERIVETIDESDA